MSLRPAMSCLANRFSRTNNPFAELLRCLRACQCGCLMQCFTRAARAFSLARFFCAIAEASQKWLVLPGGRKGAVKLLVEGHHFLLHIHDGRLECFLVDCPRFMLPPFPHGMQPHMQGLHQRRRLPPLLALTSFQSSQS